MPPPTVARDTMNGDRRTAFGRPAITNSSPHSSGSGPDAPGEVPQDRTGAEFVDAPPDTAGEANLSRPPAWTGAGTADGMIGSPPGAAHAESGCGQMSDRRGATYGACACASGSSSEWSWRPARPPAPARAPAPASRAPARAAAHGRGRCRWECRPRHGAAACPRRRHAARPAPAEQVRERQQVVGLDDRNRHDRDDREDAGDDPEIAEEAGEQADPHRVQRHQHEGDRDQQQAEVVGDLRDHQPRLGQQRVGLRIRLAAVADEVVCRMP